MTNTKKSKKTFSKKAVIVNPSMMRARRIFMGLTQKEVAEALNLHKWTVNRWEHGDWQPSMHNLVAVAKLYECDVKMLLHETARAIWQHIETVLLNSMMVQGEDMEDGKVVNLDMNQFAALADRVGAFDADDGSFEEETEAQEQMEKEIR